MIPALHIPVDFELREDVRRLAIRLSQVEGWRADGDMAPNLATLYVLRFWSDWGRAGEEWRVLREPAAEPHPWAKEEIAYILEGYARWSGVRGVLIQMMIEAGVLILEKRGDLAGLILRDFWRYNEHLSPDFKTQAQRGGRASGVSKRVASAKESAETMAGQQQKLIALQGTLPLALSMRATEEEQKSAIALVMRLDMACGRNVRSTKEYTDREHLMRSAIEVVRQFKPEDFDHVCRYLVASREDLTIVKIPERILQDFGEYLKAS